MRSCKQSLSVFAALLLLTPAWAASFLTVQRSAFELAAIAKNTCSVEGVRTGGRATKTRSRLPSTAQW